MKLRIVIVNYRTADLVLDCLKSLESEVVAMGNVQVDVVDNASGDDSVERFVKAIAKHNWSSWLTILPVDHNRGFAAGNNHAIRLDHESDDPAGYYLLLNPDTYIRPGAVKALFDFMQKHPEVGIAGSRLEYPDGEPQHSAFRFHTWVSEMCNGFRLKVLNRMLAHKIVAPPISDDAHQVDWVSGASMMVRRQVIDDVGLMDETYFLYFEEMDFCLQAHHAGWFCWYVPASRVVHLVGQATQLTDLKQAVHKRREIYWFDARRHYFLKNFGRVHKLLADVLWTIGYGTWVLRKKLLGYPDRDPQRFWRDFIDYNFFGKNLNP